MKKIIFVCDVLHIISFFVLAGMILFAIWGDAWLALKIALSTLVFIVFVLWLKNVTKVVGGKLNKQ